MATETKPAALSELAPQPAPAAPRDRRRWGYPLLVLALGAIAYANSFQGVLLFDDVEVIERQSTIKRLWPLHQHLTSGVRPITQLSLAVNYALGGTHPFGYHVFNLAVHLLAGLTLYALVRQVLLLARWEGRFEKSAANVALVGALLWIVHPLNTQAVTYIVQRSEAMAGCSLLLTLFLYLRGSLTNTRAAWLWLALAWGVYCVGLGCKEVMVTALPLTMLFDRAFLSSSWREAARRRGAIWLAMALPLVYGAVRLGPTLLSGEGGAGFAVKSVTWYEYLYSQPLVILHYLRLAIVPYRQCLDYGWVVEDRWLLGIIIPGILVLSLLAASLWLYAKRPALGFLPLAFFIYLAPTSSVVPIQDLAVEHRLYVPLAVVLVMLTVVGGHYLAALPRRTRRPALLAAVGIPLAAFLALTLSRNTVYHSASRMWYDVLQVTLTDGRPHWNTERVLTNLGDSLATEGNPERSLEILAQAVTLSPNSPHIHGNLARVLIDQGELQQAREHADAATKLDPKSARLRQLSGLIAAQEGRYVDAEKHFAAACELDAGDPVVRINRGQALRRLERHQEASACFRTALRLDPQNAEARERLVQTCLSLDDWATATAEAETLLRQKPASADYHFLAGSIAYETNRLDVARREFSAAVELNPRFAQAVFQLGNTERKLGNSRLAFVLYSRTLEIDPDHAEAHINVGGMLLDQNPAEAAEHFHTAIRLAPKNFMPRYNLASLLLQAGQLEGAIEQLQIVVTLKPEFTQAQAELEKAIQVHKARTAAPLSARESTLQRGT